MLNVLVARLGKVARIIWTVLRAIFVVLVGVILLIIVLFLGAYFWEEIRFNAITAESDARKSFIGYCQSICVNPNDFDGPRQEHDSKLVGSDEYLFIWTVRNKPEQTIEIEVVAHEIFQTESEQFKMGYPWTSRANCQAHPERKILHSDDKS